MFTDELALLLPVGAVIVGITLPQAAARSRSTRGFIECQPVAAGLQHGFRQVDFAIAQGLMRPALDAAVAGGLAAHLQIAITLEQFVLLLLLMDGQHFHIGCAGALGVIINLHRLHKGVPILPVQTFHVIGLAFVQVDGAGVQHRLGRLSFQLADGGGRGSRVPAGGQDHDGVRVGGAQADISGRIGCIHPE